MFCRKAGSTASSDGWFSALAIFTISIEPSPPNIHDAGGPAGIEAEANEFARAIHGGRLDGSAD